MENKTNLIIVLIAAAIVGFFVFWSRLGQKSVNAPVTPKTSNTKSVNPAPPLVGSTQGSIPQVDVEKLLKFDSDKINSVAVDTDRMIISSCVPNPTVVKIRFGEKFTVKNIDNQPHVLKSGNNTILEIAADSEKVTEPNFSRGAGIYGYACDNKPSAGIFEVIQ